MTEPIVHRFAVREAHERLERAATASRLEAGSDGTPITIHFDATTPNDEVWAAQLLREWVNATTELANGAVVPVLNIVTSEPLADFGRRANFMHTFGVSADPKHPAYNRLEPVAAVEVQRGTKIVELADGSLAKVPTVSYEASSAPYTMPDGRVCTDSTKSGPERFERDAEGNVVQVGAATALLRRLTEAVARA